MTKGRLHYIDIARGLGIILVVLSHTQTSFSDFIYLFHVPLFFFLSGIFYKDKDELQPLGSISKRIKSLYFPFVRYGLFFLLILNWFYDLGLGDRHITTLREFGGRLFKLFAAWEMYPFITSPLWFLPCLLFASVLFLLFRYALRFVKPCWKEPMTAMFAFVSLVLGLTLHVDWNITRTLIAIPFYYAGFLFFRYKDHIRFNPIICILALAILVWCATFQRVNIYGNIYSHPIFLVPVALLGVYVILFVSYTIKKSKALEYIGNNTVVILALHLLAFKAVTLVRVSFFDLPYERMGEYLAPTNDNLWLCIVYAVLGVGVPLLLQYVGKQVKDKVKVYMSRQRE